METSPELLTLSKKLDDLPLKDLEELLFSLGEYAEKPVDIETFVTDPKYLGGYFQGNLYPFWLDFLKKVYPSPFYSPYWLVSLAGSIGQGKTTIACVGVCYDLYRLFCLINPQKHYGLIPSTKIIMFILNVTMSLVEDVVWSQMSAMFMASPYFSSLLGPMGKNAKLTTGDDKSEKTMFPKHIDINMGSRVGHTLGKAVFSCLLDESNFGIVENQVYDSFNSLIRRMQSRFMGEGGLIPGKIWLVSSETDKSSTVNEIIKSYKNDPGVIISRAALWEVKPFKYNNSIPRFWVYAGSDTRQPEVLKEETMSLLEQEPDNCIQVPEEHRGAFESDIHLALRDLAGRSTTSSYKVFRLKDRLNGALILDNKFPDTVRLDFDDPEDQLHLKLKDRFYYNNPLHKQAPRFIHIDMAKSGDRMGIACTYIRGFRNRVRKDQFTFEERTENVPDLITEWVVGVEAVPGKEIPFFKIRMFIMWLSQQGVPIMGVTCDGFQSTDMIQSLIKMGFTAILISVDRTTDAYLKLRSAVYEGRHLLPKSELLKFELDDIEFNPDATKIDHTSKGSKDCSDAVAGSTMHAILNEDKLRNLTWTELPDEDHQSSLASMFWPGMSG